MSSVFKWISENVHWIFDGIGVTLLVCIGGFIFKKNNKSGNITINQKGGKKSINIQNNNIGSEE